MEHLGVEALLFLSERSQLDEAPQGDESGSSNWEQTTGPTLNTLEGLYILSVPQEELVGQGERNIWMDGSPP